MTESKDIRRVPFLVTKQHQRFTELCDACRRCQIARRSVNAVFRIDGLLKLRS
jgi:hypothetical protein